MGNLNSIPCHSRLLQISRFIITTKAHCKGLHCNGNSSHSKWERTKATAMIIVMKVTISICIFCAVEWYTLSIRYLFSVNNRLNNVACYHIAGRKVLLPNNMAWYKVLVSILMRSWIFRDTSIAWMTVKMNVYCHRRYAAFTCFTYARMNSNISNLYLHSIRRDSID